uniref:Uncharacterized protein n=1 Tax=Fundulus heteroclitus TaxID=8078 RepID=A0A3Q2QCV7_FUNHE
MLAQGVGRCLLPPCSRPARSSRGLCSAAAADAVDRVRALLQLCADRHYICPGESNAEMFRRGWSCGYGPLGVELRRNLLQQWWHSVSGSRARVFAVDTLILLPGFVSGMNGWRYVRRCLGAVCALTGDGEQKTPVRPG